MSKYLNKADRQHQVYLAILSLRSKWSYSAIAKQLDIDFDIIVELMVGYPICEEVVTNLCQKLQIGKIKNDENLN